MIIPQNLKILKNVSFFNTRNMSNIPDEDQPPTIEDEVPVVESALTEDEDPPCSDSAIKQYYTHSVGGRRLQRKRHIVALYGCQEAVVSSQ